MFVKKILKNSRIYVFTLILVSLFLNLYRINYGQPKSFIADEAELADQITKYVFNYKTFLLNNKLLEFKPNLFLYGTFPSYYISIILILFNKFISFLHIGYKPYEYYLIIRVVTAITSVSIPVLIYYLYYQLTHNYKAAFVASLFTALNWRLIQQSHFMNQDIYLTVVTCFFVFYLLCYFSKTSNKKSIYLLLSGLFFGLCIGTKVTSIILLLPLGYFFITKRRFVDFIKLGLISFVSYAISNPFSFILFQSFSQRMLGMFAKEGGVVFSSVDTNPFKYLYALSNSLTWPVLVLFVASLVILYLRRKKEENILNWEIIVSFIFTYILFFSLQQRRVDRYLLPVIPLALLVTTYGIHSIISYFLSNRAVLFSKMKTKAGVLLIALFLVFTAGIYTYHTGSLLYQLSNEKPKLLAYTYIKNNVQRNPITNNTDKVLVYTQEGRDPFTDLRYANVLLVNKYGSEGAMDFTLENPIKYKWVVLSTSVTEYYKNSYIQVTYPEYVYRWETFISTVSNTNYFKLKKVFSPFKLNLMGDTEIKVFERSY